MITKNSPAPWSVLPADEGESFQVVDSANNYVCKVNRHRAGNPVSDENKTNASLIAATPELFEAVQSLLDVMPRAVKLERKVNAMERARAIVAKAIA